MDDSQRPIALTDDNALQPHCVDSLAEGANVTERDSFSPSSIYTMQEL